MRRERRVLSSRVVRLEERFEKLDAIERTLDKRKSRQRKPAHSATDPEPETVFAPSDAVLTGVHTLKSSNTIGQQGNKVRTLMHEQIVSNIASVKSRVGSFLSQQQALKSLPIDLAPEYYGTMPEMNAESMVNGTQFQELFMDESSFEKRAELSAISKLIPEMQLHDEEAPGPAKHHAPSMTPTMPPILPEKGSAEHKQKEAQRPQTASPYVNPTPIQVRPRLLRKTVPASLTDAPPVPPSRRRKPEIGRPRPGTAGGMMASRRLPTAPAAKPPAKEKLKKEVNEEIFQKEFYHLHVKIQHSASRLTDWEFDVVLTDVTYPKRLQRHTVRNLKVNSNMYLVFHPPDGVTLSPVDDIPWVQSPESLFRHTFRIEVFATYPNRTQVIDSLAYFGDSTPAEMPTAGEGS